MDQFYCKDFASFGKTVWLNAASEGPLPIVAAQALQEAIQWKSSPYLLTNDKFIRTHKELRESIGQLIGVNPLDVILGNSASYGLHLLANGLPWNKGDEILLMQNDFPTNILPWLALEKKGVRVIQIKTADKVLTPQELLAHLSHHTKLFCISHVHTFSGHVLEIEQLAQICHERKIIFVLNISQSVGTMPINVSGFPIDAIVAAGYKWLCGPYGTGFCWMKPALREQLDYNQAYWSAMLTEEELKSEGPVTLKDVKSARKYDVFATANFFNFVPFKAAIDYWLKTGLEHVSTHNQKLIDQFNGELNPQKYFLISPKKGRLRSNLIVLSHRNKELNMNIFRELRQQGIYTALWKGNIRVSPHIYNSEEDIGKLLKILHEIA